VHKRRGKINSTVRRVKRFCLSDMVCLFGRWLCVIPLVNRDKRKRLFCSERTFWLFLSQVLQGNISCKGTVQKALAWLCLKEGKTASPNSAGYCKARKRLKLDDIEAIFHGMTEQVEPHITPELLWHNRAVNIVDGSSISMPDTVENQNAYPQPTTQKPGCGFPVMRLVAIFSLATGALLRLAFGPLAIGERALFHSLWQWLKKGDIVLADRGFCSFAELWLLLQRGIDSVTRIHQRRTKSVRTIKRLGAGDLLVEWGKTNVCPEWLDKLIWLSIPDFMIVRHITFSIDIKGFRTKKITIVTTLLDPHLFPKESFIDLYRRRWLAEIFLRDIKTSMGMDILKCKTPDMIQKELYLYLIAYNLIRRLMLHADHSYSVSPLRISFKETCDTLRQWLPLLQSVHLSKNLFHSMVHALLDYIALNLVPLRPDRAEPRARKRRPKQYQLLNKPRSEFKEIYHRNTYSKDSVGT
jgi:hypothetical protein